MANELIPSPCPLCGQEGLREFIEIRVEESPTSIVERGEMNCPNPECPNYTPPPRESD